MLAVVRAEAARLGLASLPNLSQIGDLDSSIAYSTPPASPAPASFARRLEVAAREEAPGTPMPAQVRITHTQETHLYRARTNTTGQILRVERDAELDEARKFAESAARDADTARAEVSRRIAEQERMAKDIERYA